MMYGLLWRPDSYVTSWIRHCHR